MTHKDSFKEILSKLYQDCLDAQKMAETKNTALITFNGAIIFSSMTLLSKINVPYLAKFYIFFILFCSITSIFLNLSAMSPQLQHRKREKIISHNTSLLFFGTISNYTPEEYLKEIKKRYSIQEESNNYHLDLARQVVINAHIALRKFKIFNLAFKCTIVAISSPLGLLVYSYFFDHNRK